jgi:hypothetical protein
MKTPTIKMLDTVEDSHAYIVKENGKPVTKYATFKFVKDEKYLDVGADWAQRATNLVAGGFAELVDGDLVAEA